MGNDIPTLGHIRQYNKNLILFFDEKELFENDSELNKLFILFIN